MRQINPDPVGPGARGDHDETGGLTGRLLKEQLNEYLARHGRDIDGLVTDLIRSLHDEAALAAFCRTAAFRYGTNVLQVVLTHALGRIGQEGYRRPRLA